MVLYSHQAVRIRRLWLIVSAVGLVTVLAWDASGFDLALAHYFGGKDSFPFRQSYALATVLHSGARNLGWVIFIFLTAGAFFPFGFLHSLTFRERIQIPITLLVCVAAIALLKHVSSTSCPWDLEIFGGLLPYVSHWNFGRFDGGGGRCFPAGHASTGFAFIGGYFALLRHRLSLASLWLIVTLMAGVILGVSQQFRGAHFASHTLWTAWICWTVGGFIDALYHSSSWSKSK